MFILKKVIDSALTRTPREGFVECGSGEMSFQRKQGFQNLDIQGHRPENREQSREKPYMLVNTYKLGNMT